MKKIIGYILIVVLIIICIVEGVIIMQNDKKSNDNVTLGETSEKYITDKNICTQD